MKPSLPQGTRDFAPDVVYKRQYILKTIQTVFELFGYQPIETPAFENLQTLTGKYGEEGDRLIFKILNNGLNNPKNQEKAKVAFENIINGKSDSNLTERALRYDLTIPFARFVVMNQNDLAFPFKRYQMQPVWRADRPQRGRYREFWQCDADVVGSNSLINEAELMSIYRESFHRLKIPKITLKINNRKVLAGLAFCCQAADSLTDITVAIDKIDKIGIDGVVKELEGRGLTNEQIEKISNYLNIDGTNAEKLSKMKLFLAESEMALQGIEELEKTLSYHEKFADSAWESVVEIDFTLARGLNYYTGFIAEVTTDAVQMGSIGGGGRYDDLTGLFGLKNLSGVGISFGVDRIYDVISELDIFPKTLATSTQVIFLNLIPEAEDTIFGYLKTLRAQGISAEYYTETAKMDKQLKYANKRALPFVAFVGEEELKNNTIKLKNMETGEQHSLNINTLKDHLN